MTAAAPPSAFLLLVSCCLSGVVTYRVEAPSHYTALQGHLTAVVYLTPTPPPTEAPLPTWDFDNNSPASLDNLIDDPGEEDSVGNLDDYDHNIAAEPVLSRVDGEETRRPLAGTTSATRKPLKLSLFAKGNVWPIKTYEVKEDLDKRTLLFPCGLVVQGGVHLFRLERGAEVVAESGEVEVSWPPMVIEVPRWVETYSTPIIVTLRFTKSMCRALSPLTFNATVDLLYHGVPVRGAHTDTPPTTTPTTTVTPSLWQRDNRPWSFLEEKLKETSVRRHRSRRNRELARDRKLKRKNRRLMKKKRRRGRKDAYERYWEWIGRHKRALEEEEMEGVSARVSVVSSGARAQWWAWAGYAMSLRRKPLGEMYRRATHEVRFPCSAIGPAGLYSVRLNTNVPTNPVVASSEWFTVVWSEVFTLHVQASNIKPCTGSIGVQLTYPSCVGRTDKVRVYARIRANVTSASPPIHEKYVVEQRISKPMTTADFSCDFFQKEATDYCFVYINTAENKIVSEVRRKCVPFYMPKALRDNGSWGSWSSWTECTSTCGPGQRLRHRFCDSPPPRNGGLYCQGEAIQTKSCKGPICVPASQEPSPASSTPWSDNSCSCGCKLALTYGSTATITASAALCSGTAIWVFEAPPGEKVVAEVAWASLRPRAQWLKLRDGGTLSDPLLVRLPSPTLVDGPLQDSAPSPRRVAHTPRRASSGSKLLLEFRSDVNASTSGVNPASWGFLVTAYPSADENVLGIGDGGVQEAARPGTTQWWLLEGMHVAAVVFVAALLAAVIVLAVYHWRRYRLYKRARLIPESPYATPPSTPSKNFTDASSTLTLTEVISLKSLVPRPKLPVSLPLKRRSRSGSYSPLDGEPPHEAPQHSLPNSPFLTRRVSTPSTLRRSSSHLGRLLRKGSGTFKRKKRRFASVDELETRCISPIHELQREDEGDSGKEGQEVEVNVKGEENSAKYREYRKSLASQEVTKESQLTPKLAKERMNLERARRSALSRSTSNATMRGASSVSDMSVNGTDTEMEYDYYDYDMDNASAVPGSLFGLDPLLLAWVPPFFSTAGDTTPPDQGIPLGELNPLDLSEATPTPTPTAEGPSRPSALSIQHLNIPHTQAQRSISVQNSVKSDEANDGPELQNGCVVQNGIHEDDDDDDDDDRTPTTHSSCSKILNNLDDIQFADDSDDDEEDAL